jgi:hypothetical protein
MWGRAGWYQHIIYLIFHEGVMKNHHYLRVIAMVILAAIGMAIASSLVEQKVRAPALGRQVPQLWDHIPRLYDYDMTKDRQNDIRFHDKTDYDIKLAQDVSDYRDFVEEMTQLANDAIKEINDQNKAANNLKKRFEGILNRQQRTLTRVTNPRYFSYLIYKRFDIDEVIKVQRKDDIHTISDKAFDFSLDTIVNLIEEGEKDALNEIVKQELEKMDKIGLEQTEKEAEIGKHLTRFMEDLKMETTTKMGILSNVQKMN